MANPRIGFLQKSQADLLNGSVQMQLSRSTSRGIFISIPWNCSHLLAAMKQKHAHILQAVFSHPLEHNLRISDIEALLRHLGASLQHCSDRRLKIELANGDRLVLHAASGLHHPYLDEEGILRLRRFLQQAGLTPEHLVPSSDGMHGEQARRLVIHFDHHGARLWWLEGQDLRQSDLRPEELWGSGQRLSHRHDRDIAGQRAPLDYAYLRQLSQAIANADRVLLLGHGHGQSDLRQVLREHLAHHHSELLSRVEEITLDDTACSDAELVAVAKAHFGNLPHRPVLRIPGQEIRKPADH